MSESYPPSFPPPDSIDIEVEEETETGRGAKRLLAVGGGRGGVGKSLVAQNLAVYFAQLGEDGRISAWPSVKNWPKDLRDAMRKALSGG